MKIAVFSSKNFERDFLNSNPEVLSSNPPITLVNLASRLGPNSAKLITEDIDAVCIFVNDVADATTLQVLADKGIHLLLLRCAGFNQVDLSAAKRLGIRVLRVPAYSPHAVAEFAVALLLTVVRKTHRAYNRTRDGNFVLRGLMGFNVQGKTIGVIGTGKIGRIFATIMHSFGARIIAYDLYQNDEMKRLGVEYVPLDNLLSQSDIISLHCPLLASTRRMISTDAINKMKRGVTLINTSRGELVDMDALIDGLQRGIIGFCGMDVIEGERNLFFEDHSGEILEDQRILTLMSFHNVLITPHVAFCTDTALNSIWSTTVGNVGEFLKNGPSTEKLTNEVVEEAG